MGYKHVMCVFLNVGYMHVMCVFQKCSKKIFGAKMCVEIKTYTICYMHEMCVFRKFSEKNYRSHNLC